MLTIFSIPKSFYEHTNIIQRNAIKSWTLLGPTCEVILCGDDPGTEDAAREFGTRFIPDIERNEFGTPLLSSTFNKVRQEAAYDLLCYVNADIILLKDLLSSIKRINYDEFMMIGRRWDLDLIEPWDFNAPDWDERLRLHLAKHGEPHPPAGSDYFVFRRNGSLSRIPPFAVGRPGWDCWFIYKARKLGIRVIDASKVVTVIHQNHDYGHLLERDGIKVGKLWSGWSGSEAQRQQDLIGNPDHYFYQHDATHILTPSGLFPALSRGQLLRRWYAIPVLYPKLRTLFTVIDNLTPKFLKRMIRSFLLAKKEQKNLL